MYSSLSRTGARTQKSFAKFSRQSMDGNSQLVGARTEYLVHPQELTYLFAACVHRPELTANYAINFNLHTRAEQPAVLQSPRCILPPLPPERLYCLDWRDDVAR